MADVTWTISQDVGPGVYWGTFYGEGTGANGFVCVGENLLLSTSADGQTWTDIIPPSTYGSYHLYGGGSNGTYILAVGSSGTIVNTTDPNGAWSMVRDDGHKCGGGVSTKNGSFWNVTWNGQKFVVVGYTTGLAPYALEISSNCATETDISPSVGIMQKSCLGADLGGGLYEVMAVGGAGGVYFYNGNGSSTGWSRVGICEQNLYACYYDSTTGTYYAGGGHGVLYKSTNKTKWTLIDTNVNGGYLMDMVKGSTTQFVFAGGEGMYPAAGMRMATIARSLDLNTWGRDVVPYGGSLLGCAADGAGIVVVAGTRKVILKGDFTGASDPLVNVKPTYIKNLAKIQNIAALIAAGWAAVKFRPDLSRFKVKMEKPADVLPTLPDIPKPLVKMPKIPKLPGVKDLLRMASSILKIVMPLFSLIPEIPPEIPTKIVVPEVPTPPLPKRPKIPGKG